MPIYGFQNKLVKTLLSLKNLNLKTPYKAEIIIIDDGSHSTELTRQLKIFAKDVYKNSNKLEVTLHSLIRNEGQSIARNYGIKIAKGKYVKFLDSDDEYYENHLNDLVFVLEKINTRSDFIFSPFDINYQDSNLLWKYDNLKGKEKKLSKVQSITNLIGLTIRKGFLEELHEKYGNIFIPGLVAEEADVLIRRLLENSSNFSYCYKTCGKLNYNKSGQAYKKNLPETGRGFLLDKKHIAGRMGEYLDAESSFAKYAQGYHRRIFKTKVCNKCREEKSLFEYPFKIFEPDWHENTCKKCYARIERENSKKRPKRNRDLEKKKRKEKFKNIKKAKNRKS